MTLGSFSRGALADLGVSDVERMLTLNETLFVEHKRDIGGEAFQVAKASAAFANTLGGWLLLGVDKARPYGSQEPWAATDGPVLVDVVRDGLRGMLDPLPPFEARVFQLDDGPVGVVRVYESADAPHINLQNGAVYVREPAGDSNLTKDRRAGDGKQAENVYTAAAIRSQGQLLALAARSREASARVDRLVGTQLPLVELGLGAPVHQLSGQIDPPGRGSVFVRLMPYTLPPRFRAWSTTHAAPAELLQAAEDLARMRGFAQDWIKPHPSGAWIVMGPGAVEPRHQDGANKQLYSEIRLVIDGAGVVGVALRLDPPEHVARKWMDVQDVAKDLIAPVIRAAVHVLRAGEILGRARCQIDLERLGNALMVEGTSGNSAVWVPTAVDISIPADDVEIERAAMLAAYAYGRAVGGRFFDPPAEAD